MSGKELYQFIKNDKEINNIYKKGTIEEIEKNIKNINKCLFQLQDDISKTKHDKLTSSFCFFINEFENTKEGE